MQRDVEIGKSLIIMLVKWALTSAFDSTDKQGGFIGAMYVNGVNVAVELVKEG